MEAGTNDLMAHFHKLAQFISIVQADAPEPEDVGVNEREVHIKMTDS